MTIKITVHGVADIKRKFDGLARKVRKTILVDALRNNTAHMEAAVREAAPEGETGRLKRSIRRTTRADGRKVKATTTIYASDKIAPHAGDVEFGTGPREKSTGQYTGEMPAKPFMRPAFEAEAAATAAAVQADIAAKVEAEASKP